MIKVNNLIIIVILISSVIFSFLVSWMRIPKEILYYKKCGKTISNEDKFIKALKKADIIQTIIYSLLIIISYPYSKELKPYKLSFIITGYLFIKWAIYYKIQRKYVK